MNKVFIYVEGDHDKIFADYILSQYLRDNKSIELWSIKYAEKPPKLVNKDIKSKSNYSYIFLSDLDTNYFPCISSRKENRLSNYDFLDSYNIVIVKEEIESWYLAGIDNSVNQFKDLDIPKNTENIKKETFDDMISHMFDSKKDCLIEIAKNFDFELAIQRNNSFKYFLNKLDNMLS